LRHQNQKGIHSHPCRGAAKAKAGNQAASTPPSFRLLDSQRFDVAIRVVIFVEAQIKTAANYGSGI
jgi:hypothetical protein